MKNTRELFLLFLQLFTSVKLLQNRKLKPKRVLGGGARGSELIGGCKQRRVSCEAHPARAPGPLTSRS